jgi:glycosyltransferase involved in cell wall biosynthesis
LGNAIALLHPIYFDEPFGLSVVESMFCGTPVIAYNRGSMPEIIENNLSGFVISDRDQAIDSVSAVEMIDRQKCYEYAIKKFSIDTMIEKYIQAYRTILDN